jgi:flagellar hook assembly protein FlgD/outer membrane protein OmpA-like peptidoglycan-associated protein
MMTRNLARLYAFFFLILCSIGVLYAGGNKEVPEIPPVTSGVQYPSPNGEGIMDSAELDFTVKLYVKSDSGYVPEYGLQIVSEAGTAVKTAVSYEKSDIGWFRALFRGFTEFTLTKKLAWDGRDDAGAIVSDGKYRARIWVVDASKNRREIELDNFIVDTTAPSAKLTAPPDLILSPDGDGNYDTIVIEQEGSVESAWNGVISDSAGNAVRKFSWAESAPGRVEWDGTDDTGAAVPDGVYSYVLSGVDRAGNRFAGAPVSGIVVDTTERGFSLTLSEEFFSPNRDGVRDEVIIRTSVPGGEVPVSWRLRIRGEDGADVISEDGRGAVPAEIRFSGLSESGAPLAETVYIVNMELRFSNGMIRSMERSVVLDLTPPSVSLEIDNPVFSPDNDGVKDTVTGVFSSDEPTRFAGSIWSEGGADPVVSAAGEVARDPVAITWNGTAADGARLPYGWYFIRAEITDRAGNTVRPEPYPLLLDTRPVSVALMVPEIFCPNREGAASAIDMIIDATEYERVARWRLSVLDAEGTPVRSYAGTESLPSSIAWDGSGDTGRNDLFSVPDGTYSCELHVEYVKGKTLTAVSAPFILDAHEPEVDLVLRAEPFIRDGETAKGRVDVEITAADAVGIARWNLVFTAQDGRVIRSEEGAGSPPETFTWEGIDTSETGGAPVDVVIAVFDQGPSRGEARGSFDTDPIAERRDGRIVLLVDSVIFAAYKHTLDSAGPDLARRNAAAIERVARTMTRFPSLRLRLEAYALNIYVGDKKRYTEEEAILLPLTERRARTVFDALTSLGVDPASLTMAAFGGKDPVAPVSDKSRWWKSRRVEFVLVED